MQRAGPTGAALFLPLTLADIMEKDPIPQATSPLATWLSYLEHLHSKAIDLGLARVSEVAGRMAILNRRRLSLQ